MNRSKLALSILAASSSLGINVAIAAEQKMNVILFLVDDMGYGDLGYAGNPFIESPNIDKFAKESTLFTNAYAAPESSPTRSSILTGQNPARLHITTWIPQRDGDKPMRKGDWVMPEEATCVASEQYLLSEALKDNKYSTCHIGKWHIGHTPETSPKGQGFDCEIGYWPWSYPKSYFSPYGISTLSDGEPNEYLNDRLTDEAIKYIKDHKAEPFFLNFWHYAVHEPLKVPEKWRKYYSDKGAPDMGKNNATFLGLKHTVDLSFGRVLTTLKEEGLDKNTIVIFFTDNGGVTKHADNGELRDGKKSLYEGGIRVPLAIYDPRISDAPTMVDTPVSSIDLYPTIISLLGIKLDRKSQHIDGVDLKPLLNGKGINDRALFWHEVGVYGHGPATAMREGDYKLLKFHLRGQNQYELYNVTKDISETKNIAKQNSELIEKMSKEMDRWLIDNNAQMPIYDPKK